MVIEDFMDMKMKKSPWRYLSLFPTSILDHVTSPASLARNIGVTFDSEINFDHIIRKICKSCLDTIHDYDLA